MKRIPSLGCLLLSAGLLMIGRGYGLAADIRDGLISYWPMDVDNGGTTPDLTSFGNTLSVSNTSTIVSGHLANAFYFNGVDQYLTLGHSTSFNDPQGLPIYNAPGGYTIALWVKGANTGVWRTFLSETSTNDDMPVLLFIQDGTAGTGTKLGVSLRTPSGSIPINNRNSTSVIWDDNWHHIAWVDTRGTVKLYVDGTNDTTSFNYTYTGAIPFDTTTIGAIVVGAGAKDFYNGAADDVAFWERPLSQAEVQSVMTNGIPTPIPPASLAVIQGPVSSTNKLGDSSLASLSITAVGAHPLAYQWYLNNTPLADQTNASLSLPAFTTSVTNLYTVIVTNSAGAATNTAYLVVLPDPPVDLTSGLVNYWPLDVVRQTTPTNTPDVYYSHNDMQLFGAMDTNNLTLGSFSNYMTFNGTSQYGKRIGGSSVYGLGTYSVAFWVKSSALQQNKIVFADGGNSSALYFLMGTENVANGGTGRLNLKTGTASTLADKRSTRIVFDGNWHHVAWVDQNGNAKLYIDGNRDETDFTYAHPAMALGNVTIGALYRTSASLWFPGYMDEVAVWNRALSWSDIQEAIQHSVPPPALVAPTITQQPVGSTNHTGERLTLSVTAAGTTPFTYQWFKDGVPVSNETNSTLNFYFTSPATNNYWVTISNQTGIVVTSLHVPLKVLPDEVNLAHGLIYYWPLNVVNDPPSTPDLYSQNDLLLSMMDPSNLVDDHALNPQKALSFDGVEEFGLATGGGAPIYLATNYSISMWIKGSPGQLNKQIFAEGGASGNFFLLGTENVTGGGGALNVKVSPGMTDRKSTRVVLDDTWHHIVWVDENGKGLLYVDGALDETDYSYTRANPLLENTTLGALLRTTTNNFFAGSIDEVAVWNRRVSLTEIGQLYTGTIPDPSGPVLPAIFAQPAHRTNAVFQGDNITFSVAAGGTAPLNYQWRKNGVDISSALNPSAVSSAVTLPAVQVTDSGSYTVVITNSAGSVTSIVAQLTVTPYTPVTFGDVLDLDFELTNGVVLQPGFLDMTTAMNGTNFSGVNVTLSPIGGSTTLDSRDRTLSGVKVTDNPPNLTQARIYNDFIFPSATSYPDGLGLQLLIERLAPNTPYALTIWSFDIQSTGSRVSDWTENASGTPVIIRSGYSCDGNVPPTHDYDSTISAVLTSSPTGKLQILARKNSGSTATVPHVFINALRLVANPILRVSNVQVVNGNLRLTVETQYPGQTLTFEEIADLTTGTWSPAGGRTDVSTQGSTVVVDFPLGTGPVFYRVSTP